MTPPSPPPCWFIIVELGKVNPNPRKYCTALCECLPTAYWNLDQSIPWDMYNFNLICCCCSLWWIGTGVVLMVVFKLIHSPVSTLNNRRLAGIAVSRQHLRHVMHPMVRFTYALFYAFHGSSCCIACCLHACQIYTSPICNCKRFHALHLHTRESTKFSVGLETWVTSLCSIY